MPLVLALFLTIASMGSVHGLRNAEPAEIVGSFDRPYWCEDRSSFGSTKSDKDICGW